MNEMILIVDDEVSTLKLLGMALEREGYRIAAAQDAGQALARIAAEIPELLILDVILPGVSGLDLCQQLRARRETATLPIFCSAPRARWQTGWRASRLERTSTWSNRSTRPS